MKTKTYNRILATAMGLFTFGIVVFASFEYTYHPNSHLWEILLISIGIPLSFICLTLYTIRVEKEDKLYHFNSSI